ncbi:MAG: four helix bundle protein [Chloroflexi bacterium]|nr:MAG: four helix bundle protein [Chloroflexota bacterium]
MQDFRKLKVWEKSHHLTLEVYKVTKSFPKEELYGLTSQLRRSCASIPANIAEGCCRSGDVEFVRFLQISAASASETDYHLLLSRDLGYLNEAVYQRISLELVEVRQMLSSLINKIRSKTTSQKLIAKS